MGGRGGWSILLKALDEIDWRATANLHTLLIDLSYFSDMKMVQTSCLVCVKALSSSEINMSYPSIVLWGKKKKTTL